MTENIVESGVKNCNPTPYN